MSDEQLEVLVTLDDQWYGPDEDRSTIFNPTPAGPIGRKANMYLSN